MINKLEAQLRNQKAEGKLGSKLEAGGLVREWKV